MKDYLELLDGLEGIKDKVVIVEGKKDKVSLHSLGVKNVVSLENKPLFRIIEELEAEEVVILTDLDGEGRKLFSRLSHGLQRNGVKVDNKFRKLLFKTDLSHIEGLYTYLLNL